MKSFMNAMFVMLVLAAIAVAGSYTVTLSTYPVKGSVGDFALGTYPNIDNGAKIDKIVIANAGATAQDFEIYTTATSTSAAVLIGTISMPAAIGTYVYDLPGYNPLSLRNVAIRKSATGSVVKATIIYR